MVRRTEACARIRSAIATRWCGSRLPASDASAPLGIRTATVGVCSKESGIDRSRIRTSHLPDSSDYHPVMPVIVQKYGGSSVADVGKLRHVAERVMQTARRGHQVVVVVSAMGDTTDELLTMAKQLSANP